MSHSDMHAPDDLLAMRAMGDQLPDAISRHVDVCERCQAELVQWTDIVTTARSATADDVPTAAPPQVWDAIADELALGNSAVLTLDTSRRRWSTSWLVAASVAGIVAGAAVAAGGLALTDRASGPAPIAAPPIVASTSLAALPDHRGNGAAEIVDTPDGKELVVDVADLSPGEGFYEVWLIDPETFQMVGLGALTNNSGRFAIPDGLDLRQYSVVDVSLEPFDGDPVHSRDSVVRGQLSA